MRIDLLTAKPAFELMLASNGFESPYSDVRSVWEIFLKFLAVPTDAEDSGCFQCTFVEATDDESESAMIFMFGRQLSSDGEVRFIQLQYSLSDRYSDSLDDIEAWTDDFPDLQTFAKHVESLSHFQLLCDDSEPQGDLFVEIPE